MSKEKAQKVINRLEGTLIADLKSLKIMAEKRHSDNKLKDCLPGGLNFTLFLTGLIASETLGFFINNVSEAGRTEENIKSFFSSNFYKKDSAFKKNKYLDILIPLRTNLAHVFGMTDLKLEDISTEVSLCVGGIKKPEIISNDKKVKLNAIQFVESIINGFEAIKLKVIQDNENSVIIETISSKE